MNGLLAVSFLALALAPQQDQIPRAGPLRIDRQFYDLAASTGGDFYFWAPGEFAAAHLRVPVHGEAVALSYGELTSKRAFDIPVESGARELTLFAGVERKDLAVLVRPDGTVARDGQGGTVIQLFQHMFIAAVSSPAAGTWRLELDGAGLYSVTAHVKGGENAPDFVRFEFVEPGGRPGHEGMFPLKRPVRAGESLACEVSLAGSAGDPRLAFVTQDGESVSVTQIAKLGDEEFAGRCAVPKKPFRVAVTGTDAKGMRFQRVESRLRVPE